MSAYPDSEINYGGALIDFLDRGDQKIKKSMCYPVTRIEMLNMTRDADGNMCGTHTYRVFVINDAGDWIEQQ